MTGRNAANRSGLLKNGRKNCLYGAFLRPDGRFSAEKTASLSAKKRTVFRKGETFLPQGSSCKCRKRGKTGLRRAFPALDGVRSRANFVCPFASHSLAGLTRGRVPAARRSVAGGKMLLKPAFGFHPAFPWVREVRAFPFCSRPAPVCTVLAGAALTFWQNVIWGLVAVRRSFGAFATGGDWRPVAPPEQAREFPRPIFLSFPELLKYTAVSIGFLPSLENWGHGGLPCSVLTKKSCATRRS